MNNEIIAGLQQFLGHKPDGYYFSGFLLSALGIIISLYHRAKIKKGFEKSTETPKKFSWLFLLWDNLKTSFVTLVVMFIIFRVFDLSSIPMIIGVGIGVSFFLDKIIKLIIDKWDWLCKVLSQDRSKFPQLPNQQDETK